VNTPNVVVDKNGKVINVGMTILYRNDDDNLRIGVVAWVDPYVEGNCPCPHCGGDKGQVWFICNDEEIWYSGDDVEVQ